MTGKWTATGTAKGTAVLTGRIANTRSEMGIITAAVRSEWTEKLADFGTEALARIADRNRSQKRNKSAEAIRAGMRDAALDILFSRGVYPA